MTKGLKVLSNKVFRFIQQALSREAQLFVGWVSGSVNYAGVGFHASTPPTFCLLHECLLPLAFRSRSLIVR
ncbi:MAG: hypothetical protein DWQ51_04405 [Microcystis wesenbergii TW10]|uniref:Uncharacterized protein n=2 Tax=Microcystis TaxID=1125 RepID=A0A552AB10_MICAE|nr:MAG: hypothetical protein DWQ51_04405 [Microcystis wesenbergii TW10]TRT82658.1 MAG: hypothetical protein EWV63_18985 [Microcystis aeruginosa Ma_OC_H_19870700_S124]